jgi:F0F1-type ATP synthase delta subunit
VRPYLYARHLITHRSQDLVCLEKDRLFFEKISNISVNIKARKLLKCPLISLTRKVEVICHDIGIDVDEPNALLIHELLRKGFFWNFSVVFEFWKNSVDDLTNTGSITITSQEVLSKKTEDALISLFEKHYPSRVFRVRYEHALFVGYTARFRDAYLDQRATTLLKKIILKLTEGF